MNIIKNKKQLKEWLEYEIPRYGNTIFHNIICITETQILQRHQVLLRKTEYYNNTNKKIMSLIYKIKLFNIQNKYCIHIPINTCRKRVKTNALRSSFNKSKS